MAAKLQGDIYLPNKFQHNFQPNHLSLPGQVTPPPSRLPHLPYSLVAVEFNVPNANFGLITATIRIRRVLFIAMKRWIREAPRLN